MENKLRFLMLKYLGDRRLRILPYKIFNTLHLYLADLRPAIVTKIVRFIWILNSTITHLKDSAWNDEARDLSPDWSINMTYKSSRSYVVKIFGTRSSMHVIRFQRPFNMKCKRCIIDWARLQVHFLLNQSLLSKVSVTFQNLKHWKNKNLDNLCFSSVSFSQDFQTWKNKKIQKFHNFQNFHNRRILTLGLPLMPKSGNRMWTRSNRIKKRMDPRGYLL